MKDCVTVGNSQLSKKEYHILQQFKAIFCQNEDLVDTSDAYLLRWLKAREFKIDQAEKMLRDHLQWRKEFFIGKNLIYDKQPLVCEEYYTGGPIGFDKEGSPVILVRFGGMDLKGILQCISLEEFRRYVVYICYLLERDCEIQTERLGRLIDNNTILIDLDGFSYGSFASKAVLDFISDFVRIFDLNYPESLKHAVLLNAPWSFTFLWKIIKPLLSEKTTNKVHIFGHGGYKDFAATIIDNEAFPAYLGGKLTDPDGNPFCVTMVKLPRKVPEYLKNNKTKNSSNSEEAVLTSADFPYKSEFTVPRNSLKNILMNVQKNKKCMLNWSFYTSGQDITFKIVKQDVSSEAAAITEHVLVEETRNKSSELEPCKGQQLVDGGSLYIMKFDNSYSWFTSKIVNLSLELQEIVNL